MIRDGVLVLADGSSFEGELVGAVNNTDGSAVTSGEVVFNTVMSGYQEVISDPSYAGQIITFTTSHLGNYGTNGTDDEAARPQCSGVIVRDLSRRASNWRSTEDLDAYLARHGVSGIAGVDTRRLTRIIRDRGAMGGSFGPADASDRIATAARTAPRTDGKDLVADVTCAARFTVDGDRSRRVVAIDCGIKTTILRCLSEISTVDVVPASADAASILALAPDGVFLSNGPGDPAAVAHVTETLAGLLGVVPIFGICMGHQLLASALGGRTFKLPFGHHGGNHPVRDLSTGHIEITSQNHNYCVDLDGVSGIDITHVNLNDHTVEGFRSTELPAFGIQYHPEAGPGPHDSRYLFARFAELIDSAS